jgi:hypothetical protein
LGLANGDSIGGGVGLGVIGAIGEERGADRTGFWVNSTLFVVPKSVEVVTANLERNG